MSLRTAVLMFAAVFLTALPLAAQDGLGEWTRKSTITLNQATEIPGMVLEPGTYVLKMTEMRGDRFPIQVFNEPETQLLTTVTSITDNRMPPDDDSLLTYHAGSGNNGTPKVLQSWFYPGELNGYEFVYPKERAKEIARLSDDYVMASAKNNDAVVAITANGTEVPILNSTQKGTEKASEGNATQRQKPGTKAPAKNGSPLALNNGYGRRG